MPASRASAIPGNPAPVASGPTASWCRGRSLPQFGRLWCLTSQLRQRIDQTRSSELRRHATAQARTGAQLIVLQHVAQYLPHFRFHAGAMPHRAPLEPQLDVVLNVPHRQLRHDCTFDTKTSRSQTTALKWPLMPCCMPRRMGKRTRAFWTCSRGVGWDWVGGLAVAAETGFASDSPSPRSSLWKGE